MKLRGHHLICLHFYRGEGYAQPFIDHLSGLLTRAEKSEPAIVVSGPDDLCSCCPYLSNGICTHGPVAEKLIREMDARALSLLEICPGESCSWGDIRNLLPRVVGEWKEAYCRDCDWLFACERSPSFSTHKL